MSFNFQNCAVVFFSIFLSLVSFADDKDPKFRTNSRYMGPNAVPVIKTEDPVTRKDAYVSVGVLTHFSRRGDSSFASNFQIILPIHKFVSIELDGVPTEYWENSDRTQRIWQTPKKRGMSKGDIRFGARFYVVEETKNVPAIGFRFLVKSTTGKDLDNRRFTNSPAYILEGLFGKNFWLKNNFIDKIRIIAKLGFMAYQQGWAKQNDAATYGIMSQFYFKNDFRLDLELRGYAGYQRGDKPIEAALTLYKTGETVDFYVGGAAGLNSDAPAWELLSGVALHGPIPIPVDLDGPDKKDEDQDSGR